MAQATRGTNRINANLEQANMRTHLSLKAMRLNGWRRTRFVLEANTFDAGDESYSRYRRIHS